MKWETKLYCMDRNRKGQEVAAARETKTRHYKRGKKGKAGALHKSRWWRFDGVAVKEIESALGNKTMNDASKKSYWGWVWVWGGVAWKENFIKRGKKGNRQQKRNGRSVRWRKDWGEICEIRGNREELFLDQCDRKGTNEYERDEWRKWCVYEQKRRARGGKKVEDMARERKRKKGWWKRRTGHYSVNLFPL